MAEPLNIGPRVGEVLYVFAVALEAPEARKWASVQSNLEAAIGTALIGAHVEAFDAQDLKGVGLTNYLTDGHGIAEEHVAGARDTLEAAGAWIVIVHDPAIAERPTTLQPQAPLTYLGTFARVQPDPSAPTPSRPVEEVAPPTPPPSPAEPEPKGSLMPLLIFAGIAVILFALLTLPKL